MTDTKPPKRKGNYKPGPGRPSKAQELGLAALIDRAWPMEQQEQAIAHMAWLIQNADKHQTRVAAFQALMGYKWGKPAQVIQHSGAIDIHKDAANMTDEELMRVLKES